MKEKIFKWILRILGVTAVGATVTACYGSPYGRYEVKGTVLDQDRNPIEGILVTAEERILHENLDSLVMEGVDVRNYSWWTTVSRVDGSFLLEDDVWYREEKKLYAIDIDGDENGGRFKTSQISFEFIELKAPDGSFYLGDYTTDEIVIVMTPED